MKGGTEEGVCAGEGGEDDVLCENNFLPSSLGVQFDEISGDDIVKKIVDMIPGYLNGIFTDNDARAFRQYNPTVPATWDWARNGLGQVAVDEVIAFFSPSLPLLYDTNAYPCRGFILPTSPL